MYFRLAWWRFVCHERCMTARRYFEALKKMSRTKRLLAMGLVVMAGSGSVAACAFSSDSDSSSDAITRGQKIPYYSTRCPGSACK